MPATTLYSALDPTLRQIRLLKLAPEHDLFLETFDEPWPQYTALSYTWGPSGNEKPIVINGIMYRARDNLIAILTAIRSNLMMHSNVRTVSNPERSTNVRGTPSTMLDTSSDWLWIDAICINQDDEVEKTHQVRMMSDIYSEAHTVLV
jgi:hypothetical protein